ncbi:hypothetical protein GW17_00056181 [Ensete ventricosum]|nr:hypothetical protein GW17_00056181 [Ensete ventricosum]
MAAAAAASSLRLPIYPWLIPNPGSRILLSRCPTFSLQNPLSNPRVSTVLCSSSPDDGGGCGCGGEGKRWNSFLKKKVVMRVGYVGTDYRVHFISLRKSVVPWVVSGPMILHTGLFGTGRGDPMRPLRCPSQGRIKNCPPRRVKLRVLEREFFSNHLYLLPKRVFYTCGKGACSYARPNPCCPSGYGRVVWWTYGCSSMGRGRGAPYNINGAWRSLAVSYPITSTSDARSAADLVARADVASSQVLSWLTVWRGLG